jgi:CBS domain-containing protein
MLWRNRLLAELARATPRRTVADVMDADAISVDADTPVFEVQRIMSEHNCWSVPVTESGLYRGMFTGDRFIHIYRQLAPDPLQTLRDLLRRGPLGAQRL